MRPRRKTTHQGPGTFLLTNETTMMVFIRSWLVVMHPSHALVWPSRSKMPLSIMYQSREPSKWLQSTQLVFSQIMWFHHYYSTQAEKPHEKQQQRLHVFRGLSSFTSLFLVRSVVSLKLIYTYSQVIKCQIALNKLTRAPSFLAICYIDLNKLFQLSQFQHLKIGNYNSTISWGFFPKIIK